MVNHAGRELHVKVVYYGPGLGGKTTNLEYIHSKTKPERRGKLISLNTESERTLFFDLLPMDLGRYKGYDVRVHLCTVPGQIALDETRKLVLRHVDGIVFVVDSQIGRIDQNVESIRNLYDNLQLQGDDPDRMPLVVQYNKRDLPDIHTTAELAEALGVPSGVTQIEASAVKGKGVLQTLRLITKGCLKLVKDPERMPGGRSPSILPGKRASLFRGLEGQGDRVEVAIPKAARLPQLED